MCFRILLIAMEGVNGQMWKVPAGRRKRHSTHLLRAPPAAFRSGCPACCSLSQLAVEGTLVLLVLVSAAPGDPILCAVNKLFYSCRVCCLKLLLWCKTLLKRVMRQLQMSPQKQCFHGSEHWSVTGWTSGIAEINCIAFEVAFFSFLCFLTLYPGKLCFNSDLLWNKTAITVGPYAELSGQSLLLLAALPFPFCWSLTVLEETLNTASGA